MVEHEFPAFKNNENVVKRKLVDKYGESNVLTKKEFAEQYDVIAYMSDWVAVKRKSDGAVGIFDFTFNPRFYYNFRLDSK